MVESTVEKILAAEKAADEVVRTIEEVVSNRRREAAAAREETRQDALRQARQKADETRAKAKAEGDLICRKAQEEAEKTARVLSTMALSRGDEVLAVVLEEIQK